MRRIIRLGALVVMAGWALATQTEAQTFNSGSTGALGALTVTTNATLATPPDGVFNYTTVTVNSGVTLRFTRNAANTPITLLASGNVTINGTIDISGSPGGTGAINQTFVAPNGGVGGPGGFDGGSGATGIVSSNGGNGRGPGGGGGSIVTAGGTEPGAGGGGFEAAGAAGSAASTGTPGAGGAVYGAPTLLPLIGGSGGGGGGAVFGSTGGGGGGAAGAIIIASSGTVTISSTGRILAQGASGGAAGGSGSAPGGGGSGGAIRLIATTISGSNGQIFVTGGIGGPGNGGGTGGAGRVRIEAFTNTLGANFGSVPPAAVSSGQPTTVALSNAPTLLISSIAGVAAPASPTGLFSTPDVTLPAGTTNPVSVAITASNIPLGTVVTVTVSGVNDGNASASGALSGTLGLSTTAVNVTIPTTQPSVISASATFVLAELGGGPVYANGEPVERVRVSVTASGVSRVSYITRSGREVRVRAQ